jgi:hypothetical protein
MVRNTYIYPPHPSMRIIGECGACSPCMAGCQSAEPHHACLLPGQVRQGGSGRLFVLRFPILLLMHAWCPGDIFAYCSRNLPKFHPISISGYHMQASDGRVLHVMGVYCM